MVEITRLSLIVDAIVKKLSVFLKRAESLRTMPIRRVDTPGPFTLDQ